MMEKAVKELETELNKLPPPTHSDFQKELSPTKPKKKKLQSIKETSQEIEEIDVSYEGMQELKEMDVND